MESFKEQAFDLFDEIAKTIPDGTPKAMHKGLLRSVMNELLKAYTSGEADGRHSSYSIRLVLCREPGNDIEAVSPWTHNVKGLPKVWKVVHELCADLAHDMWGLAPLPELSLPELEARSGTARVAMSRKKNGVAAIRVRFSTPTGGPRLVPGAPGRPEDWTMRIDIGSVEAGIALDREERDSGSPLVRD